MKPESILMKYRGTFILLTMVFLVMDFVCSFLGLFYLMSRTSPVLFRGILSFAISLAAVICTGIGSYIKEDVSEGFIIGHFSSKEGRFKELSVTSFFVTKAVSIVPGSLVIYDWLSSLAGMLVMFTYNDVQKLENLQQLMVFFFQLPVNNFLSFFAIVIATIMCSSSSFMLLALVSGGDRKIRFKSDEDIVKLAEEIEKQKEAARYKELENEVKKSSGK